KSHAGTVAAPELVRTLVVPNVAPVTVRHPPHGCPLWTAVNASVADTSGTDIVVPSERRTVPGGGTSAGSVAWSRYAPVAYSRARSSFGKPLAGGTVGESSRRSPWPYPARVAASRQAFTTWVARSSNVRSRGAAGPFPAVPQPTSRTAHRARTATILLMVLE